MSKQQCKSTTRSGKPCRAKPLRDRDTCLAHSDAETRASAGFTPDAGQLGGRPPNPRAVDVIRERLEADMETWLRPLEEALTAERVVVVRSGDHAVAERHPDHGTRLRAVAEALDRAYGRPKQGAEI